MASGVEQVRTDDAPRSAGALRQILAGTIGNVLEWYDFAVYGYLAFAIAANFFPTDDEVAGLLATFAVFAVGFLMRPLGGILVGHVGDRYGRKRALMLSVAGMAVPTVLIGILPDFQTIGVAAPILLVLFRIAQGLSVGGEYVGSMVFLVESAPEKRRGLYGACCAAGAVFGILLGSATAAVLLHVFGHETVEAWAWRLPFLAGLLLAVAGFLLRRSLVETAPHAGPSAKLPVVEAVREHPREIATLVGLTVFNAVGFYISFVFVASWLQEADGIAPSVALTMNTVNMVILVGLLVFFGWLSDRVGRVPILTGATAAAVVLALPLFLLMRDGGLAGAFLGQLGFVIIVGAFGVQPAAMVEAVGGRVRVSAVAIAYNLGMGVIGGLSPFFATWLIETTGHAIAPAYFVAGAAAISFVATRFLVETAGRPLRP
jgi:MHS family proline/betaine transporter-like MFS transporter